MGVIISSAVIPTTLTLMWKRQNAIAAASTPILGLICSLTAWLVTAKREGGAITVETTGGNNPMLAGNVVALLSPVIFVPILTYAFGADNYDYKSMMSIRRVDDTDMVAAANMDLELVPVVYHITAAQEEEAQAKLLKASRIAKRATVFMTLTLLILWPMSMYGTGYIFSKKFFTGWVAIGITWLIFSLFCVGLFPLWEGRYSMATTFKAIYLDIMGKKRPKSMREVPLVLEGIELSRVGQMWLLMRAARSRRFRRACMR